MSSISKKEAADVVVAVVAYVKNGHTYQEAMDNFQISHSSVAR
jgi:hypothetical protein